LFPSWCNDCFAWSNAAGAPLPLFFKIGNRAGLFVTSRLWEAKSQTAEFLPFSLIYAFRLFCVFISSFPGESAVNHRAFPRKI
jgi:hypothetical protein